MSVRDGEAPDLRIGGPTPEHSDANPPSTDGSRDRHLFVWRDVMKADGRIGAETHHVLLALSCYADMSTGRCWPGHANLARDVRRSERIVRKHVATGVELGYVEVEHRAHGGRDGSGHPTVYRLVIPRNTVHHKPQSRATNTGHPEPQSRKHRNLSAETPAPERANTGHQEPPNSQELSQNSEGGRDLERALARGLRRNSGRPPAPNEVRGVIARARERGLSDDAIAGISTEGIDAGDAFPSHVRARLDVAAADLRPPRPSCPDHGGDAGCFFQFGAGWVHSTFQEAW